MVNNLPRWRLRISLVVVGTFLGCSGQNVRLIHLETGSTVRCHAEGVGLMAKWAEALAEDCIKKHEREGYVAVERLSPAERADLERRGLLPKDTPSR